MSEYIPPRVFVSYSWSSVEHTEWVLDLAKRLRNPGGVDVVLDRWDLQPGQDKYHFMEQMVRDDSIVKVLMICDHAYAQKADERKGGVGDETQIISPDVYASVSQSKFLPVIAEKDEQGKPYKPHYLKARLHIDLSDVQTFEENYETLLRAIHNKPVHTPPPVSEPPSFLLTEGSPQLQTAYRLEAFKDALLKGKGHAAGMAADYLQIVADELASRNVVVRLGGNIYNEEAEQKVFSNITDFQPYRDEFVDFVTFVSRYGDDVRLYDAIRRFFVSVSPLVLHQSVPHGESGVAWNDVHSFLIPELFLYTIAALVKNDRFYEASTFLTASYPASSDPISNSFYNYHLFVPYMQHVHESQKHKAYRNSFFHSESVAPKILRERATHNTVTYNDLADIDYAIFVRSVLRPAQSSIRSCWTPITLPYSFRRGFQRGCPLFLRAASHSDFRNLCTLMNVQDKVELNWRVDAACAEGLLAFGQLSDYPTQSFQGQTSEQCEQHKLIMNLSNLDTM